MKRMTAFTIVIILCFLGMTQSVQGGQITLEAKADSTIQSGTSDKNLGKDEHLQLSELNSNVQKFYMRFKLPDDQGLATSATFKIVLTGTAQYNHICKIYGVNEDAEGQDWSEVAITWNNAPKNNKTPDAEQTGTFVPISDIAYIGSFNVTGQAVGTEFVVSSPELLDFINRDVDRLITLMFTTTSASSGGLSFASRENNRYAHPRLEMDYISIEELDEADIDKKKERFSGAPMNTEPWNLIINGEFDGGGLLPTGWSAWPDKQSSDVIMFRDTSTHRGVAGYPGIKASVLIDQTVASSDLHYWYQDSIKVKSVGKTLALIAYAKTEGIIEPASVSIDFYDSNDKVIGTEVCAFPSGNGQWHTLNDRLKVPVGAEKLKISLVAGSGNGKTWFDRILLCEMDEELEELARNRWHNWRKARKKFPTAGWTFFDRIDYGPQGYQNYADAGLSMVKLPVTKEDYGKAKPTGMEMLLIDPNLSFPMPTDTSVIGYFLRDEPTNRGQMVALAKDAAKIYREDQRGAIPMVNQWGGNILDEVMVLQYPCYLMATSYQLMEDGSTRSGFYPVLENVRKHALAHNIGFMGWALVTKHSSGNTHFRQASESDICWQVYSIVAYGGKGIFYYRYFRYFSDSTCSYMDHPPSPTYYHVQAVNAELDALWPVINPLRSTGVFHCHKETNPDKIDGAAKQNGEWNMALYKDGDVPVIEEFKGDKFLLGTFENMDYPDDESIYVMIQNKQHAKNTKSVSTLKATACFKAAPWVGEVCLFDVKDSKWKPLKKENGDLKLTLSGGQGMLLRFRK